MILLLNRLMLTGGGGILYNILIINIIRCSHREQIVRIWENDNF